MGEINDDNWRSDLDISGLSLMDEDDSLLFFPDPTTGIDKEDRGLDLFGDIYNCKEEGEEVMQPRESSELEKVMKYNLRKSLAWDKAFFTNAGVLEPDELSNMIESNHVGEKKILATIQEDVKRSTESVSTLKSDCTVETSQEDCVLFGDVRASIHRSAGSADDATPDKELGEREAVHSPTSSTLDDPDSHEKVKPNGIRKRPQGLGKVTKQPAKEHNTSISRPSTGLSRSARASVDVNKTKLTGESCLASRVTVSRRIRPIVSKPGVPSKSALSASRNELTSSRSSLESCISASSSVSKKSVSQKKAQSSRIASSSLANGSTSSRAASKLISQSRVSPLSVSASSSTYKPRLSSNASLLTSSVDWSFRASTPNKMVKSKKKNTSVSGGSSPAIDDTKALKDDHKSGGSASMTKPTGLRVPSPKLGYFDGGRRTTPTGSCTGPGSGLAKRSMNESSTTCSRIKPQLTGSRLIQESTNSKAKARPVSRTSRVNVSASSAKLTSKTYSKVSAEEQLNGNLAQ